MMINWIIKGLTFFLVYWQIFGSETVTSAECNVTVFLLLLAHCLFLPPVVCVGGEGGSMFGHWFAVHYLVSFLVLQASR